MSSILGSPKGLSLPAAGEDLQHTQAAIAYEEQNSYGLIVNCGTEFADDVCAFAQWWITFQREVDCRTATGAFGDDSERVDLRNEWQMLRISVLQEPADDFALLLRAGRSNASYHFFCFAHGFDFTF